jgi:hypothetical protein
MIWADRVGIFLLCVITLIVLFVPWEAGHAVWQAPTTAPNTTDSVIGMYLVAVMIPWLLMRGLHFMLTGRLLPRRYYEQRWHP